MGRPHLASDPPSSQRSRSVAFADPFERGMHDFLRRLTATTPGTCVFAYADPENVRALPPRVTLDGRDFAIAVGDSGSEVAIHQLPSPLQIGTTCCDPPNAWYVRCEHGPPSTQLLKHIHFLLSHDEALAQACAAPGSELVSTIIDRLHSEDEAARPNALEFAGQAIGRISAHWAYLRRLEGIFAELATIIVPSELIPRAQRRVGRPETPYTALAQALRYSGVELRGRLLAELEDLREAHKDLAEVFRHDGELLDQITREQYRARLWDISRDVILAYKLPFVLGEGDDASVVGLNLLDRARASALRSLGMLCDESLARCAPREAAVTAWQHRDSEALSERVQQLLAMVIYEPPHAQIRVALRALQAAATALSRLVKSSRSQLIAQKPAALAEEARLKAALEAKRGHLQTLLIRRALGDIEHDLRTALGGVSDAAIARSLRDYVTAETKIAVSLILDGPQYARAYLKGLLSPSGPDVSGPMPTGLQSLSGQSGRALGCRDMVEETELLERYFQLLLDCASCAESVQSALHGQTDAAAFS